MGQAILKTSMFVPHAERTLDENYGSIACYHCELLNPVSNKGARYLKPKIQFFNVEWQQNIEKISVLIEPRHKLSCKALPRDGLEKKSDFVFITQSRDDDQAILQYVLDIQLIEKIRELSLAGKPMHVFSIIFEDCSQVDEGFWVDCEKADFHRGQAINNFRLETEYTAALHVGRICDVNSFTVEQYEAMSGTDPVLTYVVGIEKKYNLQEYAAQKYSDLRKKYVT